jgi:phage-related tail fiber protein
VGWVMECPARDGASPKVTIQMAAFRMAREWRHMIGGLQHGREVDAPFLFAEDSRSRWTAGRELASSSASSTRRGSVVTA